MQKHFLLKIILLLTLLFQSSCVVTKTLWNEDYDETFRNFLISEDGKYVVFLGGHFDYVLTDESSAIREMLLWPNRHLIFINTDKTRFEVDHHNNVKGYVVVESLYEEQLNKEQLVFLKSLGYKNKNGQPLSIKIQLKGTRYLPNGVDFSKFISRLDRTYITQVHYSPGLGKRIEDAALTPITLVADSFILFGKILLLPFQGN